MTYFMVVDQNDSPRSLGTSDGSPLPSGWHAYQLSASDFDGLRSSALIWLNAQAVANPVLAQQNTATATAADLLAKARTALANNATFLATVPARRAAIAADKTTATTGQSATVGSLAQAQTQARSTWTVVTHAATALGDLNDQIEALTKQNTTLVKLIAGLVMGATDLLQDETGT